MKRFDRPRTSSNSQPRRPVNFGRKDQKPHKGNGLKPLNAAQLVSKVLDATAEPFVSPHDSTTGSESSEVYDNINVHFMDDAKNSEEVRLDTNEKMKSDENLEAFEGGNDDESDPETNKDSISSSQGDFYATEEEKLDKPSVIPKSKSSQDRSRASKGQTDTESIRSRSNTFNGTPKKSTKSSTGQAKVTAIFSSNESSENQKAFSKLSSGSSEAIDYKLFEEGKDDDIWQDALHGVHTLESENEATVPKENKRDEVEEELTQKIRTLETQIEKLKEELRVVGALELSLYSVVPEHGSSAHKFHTPARRLSRIYMLAAKNWTQNELLKVTKNVVSGLVLVSNSCSSDVPRLTFWLSNIIVLREIISQAFSGKNANGSILHAEYWKDMETLLAALRKVESWIFTRTVDSIWLQVMMIHVKSQTEDTSAGKTIGKLLGPPLGDQQQGSFSVSLWKNAFEEALRRLCPFRAEGLKCGCFPALARMVMKQCIARLDVAMFNAILRESAHQIPTDPISDPIGDPRVLPIPAGDLSFGSGAQLKNAVGNWSRLLTDIYDTGVDDSLNKEQQNGEVNNHMQRGDSAFKPFPLLNELSDLLMLPKDMLVDPYTRDEVCPSIGLTLIKRILCNFTPDEFCPDPIPGVVLEELNAQSMLQGKSTGDSTTGFPRQAAPVFYNPPSCAQLLEMVAEFSEESQFPSNTSAMQKKGHTSKEELEELESSLAYIIDTADGSGNSDRQICFHHTNERHRLLEEDWLL